MTRARDLGIPFPGDSGELNAITDVHGTLVGQATIISGHGPLVIGEGPVRTGVTAVLPRGRDNEPVFAAWYTLNGNGEMTGTTWVEECGVLEGPVMITNTASVGLVRDTVIAYSVERPKASENSHDRWFLPVVAETYDGFLNDIHGFHVRREHVYEALDSATAGLPGEGNVGGGTGMICHGFKGGIGTASRVVGVVNREYTVGVLVQANHGARKNLIIAGVQVGLEIPDLMPARGKNKDTVDGGSIIVVAATDAPLLPHQLKRLARRVPIGIARVGGFGANSSGDIFIAYATANRGAAGANNLSQVTMLPDVAITPLFEAVALATEEAIVNSLIAAETMEGRDGNSAFALPHDRLRAVLKRYNRLEK